MMGSEWVTQAHKIHSRTIPYLQFCTVLYAGAAQIHEQAADLSSLIEEGFDFFQYWV